MKHFKLSLIAISLLAGSASLYADKVDFGSESQTEWAATSADGCDMGSTVTLDGVVVTLGSPDDTGVNWTWHAKNAGLLPSQMPSTEGTAGAITITAKASANAAQPLIFVTLDKNDPTVILSAQITPWDANVTQWTYEVDADHTYMFFQQSYPGQLGAYRITLRGISFVVDEVVTGLNQLHAAPAAEQAFDLGGRPANGKSGLRIVNGRKVYFK